MRFATLLLLIFAVLTAPFAFRSEAAPAPGQWQQVGTNRYIYDMVGANGPTSTAKLNGPGSGLINWYVELINTADTGARVQFTNTSGSTAVVPMGTQVTTNATAFCGLNLVSGPGFVGGGGSGTSTSRVYVPDSLPVGSTVETLWVDDSFGFTTGIYTGTGNSSQIQFDVNPQWTSNVVGGTLPSGVTQTAGGPMNLRIVVFW